MTASVAIVGAGQIGFAAAQWFFGEGWNVTILSSSRPAWVQFARQWQPYVTGVDPAPHADVVLDTIAYDETDIAVYDPGAVGRLIVISSASVYCDDANRTLDEGPVGGYPEFAGPITEAQATVAPGPATYSTRKMRMESAACARFGERATILRPCAIHGPWSRHPREWWFVKRLLDGRRRIPLIHHGRSRFQTTDVEQIARTAQAAAANGIGGVFNIADSDCPNVLEIGEAISGFLEREVDLIPVEGTGLVGRTPWSLPGTFAVDGSKAMAMYGDNPWFPYTDHVQPALQWLCQHAPTDWRVAFPQLAGYPWDLFDYAAEDHLLAAQ